MAVLCTKEGATLTKTTDVNGFNVCYSYNPYYATTTQWNYVYNFDLVPFTSNNTLARIHIPISSYNPSYGFDMTMNLLKSDGTCTVDSTTDLVTKALHGYSTGDAVQFSTTGTIPGGIVTWANLTGYVYYIRVNDANTFYLYEQVGQAIAGGATGKVNITSNGTGTLTCWKSISEKRNTEVDYNPQGYTIGYGSTTSGTQHQFILPTPVAVTTTDTYRIALRHRSDRAVGVYYACESATGKQNYLAVSTDTATYSNGNDFLACMSKVEVDINDFYPKAYAGVGSVATSGASMWIGNSTDRTFGNDATLTFKDNVAAARTWTLDSNIWCFPYSGIKIGSVANPITMTYPFTVVRPVTNSLGGGGAIYGNASLYLYGADPTGTSCTTLAPIPAYTAVSITTANPAVVTVSGADLVNGSVVAFCSNSNGGGRMPSPLQFGKIYYVINRSGSTCNLALTSGGPAISTLGSLSALAVYRSYCIKKSDLSADLGWAVGDYFIMNGVNTKSVGDPKRWYISDVNADAIATGEWTSDAAMNSVIGTSYNSLIRGSIAPTGTTIWRPNSYPIRMRGSATIGSAITPNLAGTSLKAGFNAHCYVNGVSYQATGTVCSCGQPPRVENTLWQSKSEYHNCMMVETRLADAYAHTYDTLVDKCTAFNTYAWYQPTKYTSTTVTSGKYIVRDVYAYGAILWGYQPTAAQSLCTFDMENVTVEGNNYDFGLTGTNSRYKNIRIINSEDGFCIMGAYNCTYEDMYVDNTGFGLSVYAATVATTNIGKNFHFGESVANTVDINFRAYPLMDVAIDTIATTPSVNITSMETITGSLKLSNYAGITGNHKAFNANGYFQSCGDGLPDTTVHTSGTGKYSMRFENTYPQPLTWTQTIPTSNIQNKTMVVGVWCNINSANYWAGVNTLPRLTIVYDGSTTAYCQAGQSTGWQFLYVAITPTTTAGSITVTLSTETDATSTNAYVYWDDIAALYPAGHQLNLGGLDDWAGGLPVVPSIATNISAGDIWNMPTSVLTGSGTIGKFVTKLLSVSKFLGLK